MSMLHSHKEVAQLALSTLYTSDLVRNAQHHGTTKVTNWINHCCESYHIIHSTLSFPLELRVKNVSEGLVIQ